MPKKGEHWSEEEKKSLSLAHIGFHPSEETRKKLMGRTPWNKGKYGIYSEERRKQCASYGMLGKKHKEETRKKIGDGNRNPSSEKRKKLHDTKLNEKNPCWKGDDVGYWSVHDWVTRRKPKPAFCEQCGNKPPYDLSNKEHTYRRNIEDYAWLCRSCHKKNDIHYLKK